MSGNQTIAYLLGGTLAAGAMAVAGYNYLYDVEDEEESLYNPIDEKESQYHSSKIEEVNMTTLFDGLNEKKKNEKTEEETEKENKKLKKEGGEKEEVVENVKKELENKKKEHEEKENEEKENKKKEHEEKEHEEKGVWSGYWRQEYEKSNDDDAN